MTDATLANAIDSVLDVGNDFHGFSLTVDFSNIDVDEEQFTIKFSFSSREGRDENVEESFEAVWADPARGTLSISRSMRTCLLRTIPKLINQKLHKISSLSLENTKMIPGLALAIIRALVTPSSSQSTNDDSRDNNGDDPMDVDDEQQEQEQQKSTGHESMNKTALCSLTLKNCNHEFLYIPDGQQDKNQFTNLTQLTLNNCFLDQEDQRELSHHLMRYSKASLESLEFTDVTFFQERDEITIAPIMMALSCLDNIEKLTLTNSLRRFNIRSLSFLSHFIQHSFPKLKDLNFNHHQPLFPNNYDFDGNYSFFTGIMARESLKRLSLDSSTMSGPCWEDLGLSLQTSSVFEEVKFTGPYLRWTEKGMKSLARGIETNTHLKTFRFEYCRFQPEVMRILAPAFCKSKSLEKLAIGTANDASTLELLSSIAAAGDSCNIKHFTFKLDEIGPETSAGFGDLLTARSKSLVSLTFRGNARYDETFAAAICRGFRSNTRIQLFTLSSKTTSPEADKLLLQGIAENYSIICAYAHELDEVIIDFYGKLNWFGRKKILDPKFPTSLLPEMYSKLKNVDHLYYFIRQKPLAHYGNK